MARPEKVAAVDEIKEKITSSGATVITEYRGLSVPELAQLRAALRDSGTSYKIYKNTLAKRAVEAADLAELGDLLIGPTAWAFVDGDVVSAAKALKEFAKGNEALIVKGGLLEGQIITPEQVSEIAELPSREELLAKIAGAFKAPMAKAAGLFSAIQRNTAYGIKALIDKRIAAGEELPAPATDESEDGAEAEAPAGEAADAAEASGDDDASPEGSEEAASTEEESGPEASEGSETDSDAVAADDGSSADASAEDDSSEAAEAAAEGEEAADDAGQEAAAEADAEEPAAEDDKSE